MTSTKTTVKQNMIVTVVDCGASSITTVTKWSNGRCVRAVAVAMLVGGELSVSTCSEMLSTSRPLYWW